VRYTEEWTNKFLYLDPGNRSRIKRTGRWLLHDPISIKGKKTVKRDTRGFLPMF
jgi:hypothetical protein